jgi:hypothetical protein
MSQQPVQTTLPLAPNPASEPESASSSVPEFQAAKRPSRHATQRIPRWLVRAELSLRVLLRLYIGLAICYAPWSRMFWEMNPLFLHFPALGSFAAHGAVRGVVSGLGLLNLWIAFHDALHHRDG